MNLLVLFLSAIIKGLTQVISASSLQGFTGALLSLLLTTGILKGPLLSLLLTPRLPTS